MNKDLIDEIIFKIEKPGNRIMLELMTSIAEKETLDLFLESRSKRPWPALELHLIGISNI